MIIVSLFIGGIMSAMMTSLPESEDAGFISGIEGGLISALYILASLIYFFPVWYLYNFSSKTVKAIDKGNNEDLTDGLRNLKSCFKFLGIMTLVILALYALILLVGILGGLSSFAF